MSDTPAPAPADAPTPMEVDGTTTDAHATGIASLVEMGFDKEPAAAALKETGGNLEAAMEILVNRGEGATTGDATAKVAKSIRCVDTGKLFRNMNAAMIYAERSGNTNFEECDTEIPPMTPEEKAAKIEELKQRIITKRAAREKEEKADAKTDEMSRRAGGREMAGIKEEHDKIRRAHEYEQRRKEKEAAQLHRERLRVELAKDKAERAADRARKEGKDPTQQKLAYTEAYDRATGKGGGVASDGTGGEVTAIKAQGKVREAVKNLVTYRAGGDGDKALGILSKLVGNTLKNESEVKYRTVKLGNKTIKDKVIALRGGQELLKAVGFIKNVRENTLVLDDENYSEPILQDAVDQITAALAL